MRLRIYEPPRFFEAFLRGRRFTEVPDITARICGICPVAYQMSSIAAMEDACGVEVPEAVRALRRLLYCGEWVESHALHVFMLHAPDFLGYASAFAMARDHREIVERALRPEEDRATTLMRVVGGREIHPVNVRVGGFYRAPRAARAARRCATTSSAPASSRARPSPGPPRCPARRSRRTSPSSRCRARTPTRSSRGRTLQRRPGPRAAEFDEHVIEEQVPHSTALHAHLRDGTRFLVGPLARYARNRDTLAPVAREAADAAGLGAVVRNPFRSIVVRCVEILQALDDALAIIAAYEPPDPPAVAVAPRAGVGYGWSEAPRGTAVAPLRDRRRGHDPVDARIVPPTSQNQARIEQSVRGVVERHLALADDELRHRCEQAVRSYDPCISCATHFLRWRSTAGDARDRRRQRVAAATTAPGLAVAARAPRRHRARPRGRPAAAAGRCGRAPSRRSSSTPRAPAHRPGTVHRFDAAAAPLPAAAVRSGTHAFGVADAVELARALGRLPARLDVYAIEGGSFAAGDGLTPAVARAVVTLAERLGS